MVLATSVLLQFFLFPGEARAADSCRLVLEADVPFGYTASDLPIVPVVVFNRTLRMLFDTGSVATSIEGSVAVQLGFHVPDGQFQEHMTGAGGDIVLTKIAMPLTLGRLNLGPSIGLASDPKTLIYQNQFDGILGGNNTDAYDEEFDPTAGHIRLFSRRHCPGQVVYWATEYSAIPYTVSRERHLIEFPVKVNGKLLRGLFDTGNSHTSMRWQAASDHFGLTTASAGVYGLPSVTQTADGSALSTAQYTFETMEFGDLKLHNPVINLIPQYSQNALTDLFGIDDWAPEIIVGMDVLHQLRFYISRNDKMIYFTVPPPLTPAAKPS